MDAPFQPRSYQIPVIKALNSGIKRVVWCAHRRSGKDLTILNWCLLPLCEEICTCYYVFPSYAQAKKAIWDGITSEGRRIIDFIPRELIAQKNSQEMKIRFVNGSLLQLIGSDNIDSLMGTNPKIVVFSEYALQDPQAWDYIRPILRINGGYAIFISTPRGRNHFYDMYQTAERTEGWFSQKLTINDTKVLTTEDIQKEREEGMSEELIQQEYYCSFDRGVEGSYYAPTILKMRKEDRITPINYDPYKLVHVAYDLGWDDSTAMIFFQISGDLVKVIDCEEFSNKTLADMASILRAKPYKYGTHLFPHDVETTDGLSTGCTRRELLENLDIQVTTVKKGLIADGIESVRALMISRMMIDSNRCDKLVKSLEHYHREWDEKHKVYSNKPRHDWASHYADAMRYLAVGLIQVPSANRSLSDDTKALKGYWG